MEKAKKLYLFSLGFLIVSLVFVALLIFSKIINEDEEYILVERIFSSGISVLFFYLSYFLGALSLTLSILSLIKNSDNLHLDYV